MSGLLVSGIGPDTFIRSLSLRTPQLNIQRHHSERLPVPNQGTAVTFTLTRTTVDPDTVGSPTRYLDCDVGEDLKSTSPPLGSYCAGKNAKWLNGPGLSISAGFGAAECMYHQGLDL